MGGGILADSEITVGISNVLDTSPPLVAPTGTIFNGYSPYGDPRLRRYSISLRKSFR